MPKALSCLYSISVGQSKRNMDCKDHRVQKQTIDLKLMWCSDHSSIHILPLPTLFILTLKYCIFCLCLLDNNKKHQFTSLIFLPKLCIKTYIDYRYIYIFIWCIIVFFYVCSQSLHEEAFKHYQHMHEIYAGVSYQADAPMMCVCVHHFRHTCARILPLHVGRALSHTGFPSCPRTQVMVAPPMVV